MGWVDDFCFSMSSMSMPVPTTLFEDAGAALATIKSIQEGIGVAGDKALPELVEGAGLAEDLTLVGSVMASFYLGACIGAAIYASAIEGYNFLERMAVSLERADLGAVRKALEVGVAAEMPILAEILTGI